MKIYGYQVGFTYKKGVTTFGEVIDHINSLKLADRFYAGIRLESIIRSGGILKLDFSRLRQAVLPGKATQATNTTSLGLLAGEAVSEETAAIYISKTNTLAIQYNQFGPHRTAIENYINNFTSPTARKLGRKPDGEGLSISPYINANVQAQFAKMSIFKKIDMKVATPPIGHIHRTSGMSLGAVVDMGLAGGTETAHIVLSAGRGKASSLNRSFIKDAINYIKAFPHGVEKLCISAKEAVDSEIEILDLLDSILKHEIDISVGADRRYPRTERLNAIETAINYWSTNKLIK
ncbi:DUF6731 family protein [Magnetospirillum moscoviense]|uniref:DUF6731 family protein n=1 Tax=Magnetospirillum moscoviense TaxID=1437059 RepID=UPI000AC35F6F|nr:DUF6731 family protein [Magnetospirillum moscoviense]